jgi:hypothetical protein
MGDIQQRATAYKCVVQIVTSGIKFIIMQQLSLKEQDEIIEKLIKENPDSTIADFWEIKSEIEQIIKSRYEYHTTGIGKFPINSKGNAPTSEGIFPIKE